MANKDRLTTAAGIPVQNDQASITTGEKGSYTLLQDQHLIEKLAHFDRERIPERVVHAKGAGAFGYFEVTRDLSRYTCAKLFGEVGKRTELAVRFSTVGGERGSADSARDPRGFAVKLYTGDGNYDIVGNNTPVFFIRDAIKFPDFIHTQKRNPATNLPDPNMVWDFLSLTPESLHQVTILFSDRGTPKNYRENDGHSSHTFMWYNKRGEHFWIKYHFKADLGFHTLTSAEAHRLASTDPDHATRDLHDAIAAGNYPSWTLYVQIMTPEQAKSYKFDPFDVTKVWYHSDFPLIELGKMVLNRNPTNYFAEVEQIAFCPGNFVPGVGPSPDKLLQGRLFAYGDTQRWRLGANFQQIPVNMPRCQLHTNQRDGMSQHQSVGGPNYWPNSLGSAVPDSTVEAPPALEIQAVIDRHTQEGEEVDFIQPGELYRRVLDDVGRAHLISNIAESLGGAAENLRCRQAALFYKADPDYGLRVAEAVNIDPDKVRKLAAMSQRDRAAATPFAG
ncbi:MAG: catalase [Victivallaceae bacterium]|nr:catalase [Victivallaceae bacterium]